MWYAFMERKLEKPGFERTTEMGTKSVVVLPYDEYWAQAFELIKSEIQEALGSLALRIEHVGSTSVRGLSAKPIIDIDVVIKDYSVFDAVVAALKEIGYHHEGDLGIAAREVFKYDGKEQYIDGRTCTHKKSRQSYKKVSKIPNKIIFFIFLLVFSSVIG